MKNGMQVKLVQFTFQIHVLWLIIFYCINFKHNFCRKSCLEQKVLQKSFIEILSITCTVYVKINLRFPAEIRYQTSEKINLQNITVHLIHLATKMPKKNRIFTNDKRFGCICISKCFKLILNSPKYN